MGYTYNGIRTIVQSWEGSGSEVIARLQPISGGIHIQHFGYDDEIIKIAAFIVGETDLAAIKTMFKGSGTSYTLALDGTSIGDFFPHTYDYTRVQCVSQTMRPDLACASPVYRIEMELYPDA
jgi:hypothetical protein